MPITAKVEGMQEISEMLSKLEQDAPAAAAAGLYDGAGVMAAEISKGADAIQTAPFHYAKFITRDPSPEEKAAVQNAVGIAKFDRNGSEVNTSVGYGNAGYADVAGKQKPIAQIANAINSGTSFLRKQPFVRKAASSGAKRAEEATIRTIEERLNKITEG